MVRKIGPMETFTLFWHGPFSQWLPCMFEVDGVQYNCAEQYMMAEKARLFSDKKACDLIMKTFDPSTQKKLGRQIKGFDVQVWEKVAKDIVYKGNKAKFTQNPNLKQALLNTKGTTLVEASPYDRIWGIGLAESDPRCKHRTEWQGLNWLGEVLTKLREELLDT